MSDWTAYEDLVLQQMADEGKSYRDAAERLDRTRSAVAGRADRLKIKFHGPCCARSFPPRSTGRKLTVEIVREIKSQITGERGEQIYLANAYGVHKSMIQGIKSGRNWKHA